MELTGLHHVTAITARASANVDFYTRVLGLRLVKKTVNQDDVSAYHLFYADGAGSPGTDMTFFDWDAIDPQKLGAGQISMTAFRVPGKAALTHWGERFDELGVSHGEVFERDGRATLAFSDPEGQQLELVDDSGAEVAGGEPWSRSTVPAAWGIRGLEGITIAARSLERTESVLLGVLGFRQSGEYFVDGNRAAVYATGAGGPGTEVRVVERPDLPINVMNGAGGVHHAAFRTPNDEEQAEWHRRLTLAGLPVSSIIDRFYFHSIYFRIPGGVLFEIATDGPGFATDEPLDKLGESLALPPFLEPQRRQIEANLKPLVTSGASGASGASGSDSTG
ncbi:MAG TPA: ring-cleaving dioxygenase [Thermomicrobiaceae bacterium]|nr:ring-cleaving dioxygenase [Thermomicrobiaceae bacterium]